MENMNLLDLDNYFLNIIGDYVKKDSIERDFQEYMMKEIGTNSNKLFKIIIKFSWKKSMRNVFVNYFFFQ
jgi:hypothetical protein